MYGDWMLLPILFPILGGLAVTRIHTLHVRRVVVSLLLVAELALVLVAVRQDLLVEETYARTAVLLFLIGNEGLSVLENLGLMGAPYPAFLKNALSVLREQGDRGKA